MTTVSVRSPISPDNTAAAKPRLGAVAENIEVPLKEFYPEISPELRREIARYKVMELRRAGARSLLVFDDKLLEKFTESWVEQSTGTSERSAARAGDRQAGQQLRRRTARRHAGERSFEMSRFRFRRRDIAAGGMRHRFGA